MNRKAIETCPILQPICLQTHRGSFPYFGKVFVVKTSSIQNSSVDKLYSVDEPNINLLNVLRAIIVSSILVNFGYEG